MLAEGKVHTHCLPGARVLDVSVQIPAILKDDESVAAVVIHAGANDTKLRQTETLKRDFRSLVETVRSTSPATIYSDILNVTQKTGYRFDSFEILMLNVKLSDKQNKSVLSLALATVYRPPGPYTDFLKEFADFLSDVLVNVDKALIVEDFNIHVDNTNDQVKSSQVELYCHSTTCVDI